MKTAELSEEEYKMFHEQLNYTFEQYIKDKPILPTKEQVEALGIKLHNMDKAKEVSEISNNKISANEFYCYSKNKQELVFYFWKHLRNCASHKNRIRRLVLKNEQYYFFEDKWGQSSTMKGIIRADKWCEFIDSLSSISRIAK